jgi:type IV pilus assembly protein PilV
MNKSAGFTLIEVLIAMIILAGGLLGLAGLQATSLKNNQSAYNRIKATQLAYDIADRMRANYAEAKKSKGDNVYLDVTTPPTKAEQTCTNTTGCNPGIMALNDLFEWSQALDLATNPSGGLPNGKGKITNQGVVYTITIDWTENIKHYNDGSSDTTSFEMSFQL